MSDPALFDRILAAAESQNRPIKNKRANSFMTTCPAHADTKPSLSVKRGDRVGAILKDHAHDCAYEAILRGFGLWEEQPPGFATGARGPRTDPPLPGCTLDAYAEAKQLPKDFLLLHGVRQAKYGGTVAVRIAYFDEHGREDSTRFRTALTGEHRFFWTKGSKARLYGRNRLAAARATGAVLLVEGESDCQTAWLHDVAAMAVPGAGNFAASGAEAHLADVPRIDVIREPDGGGDTLIDHLTQSAIRDRVFVVDLGEYKDVSALHLAEPKRFSELLAAARSAAIPLTNLIAEQQRIEADEHWERCAELARQPDILALVLAHLAERGVVGEARTIKLEYLIATSRVLTRPASAAIKGPSSCGKSHVLEKVLELFPADAFYALSAMSEHALAYSQEPLVHRMLVLYEADGLNSDFASYLMRTLLSEGRIRYETVEKTPEGMRSRLIEREGPTGLLVTTTAVHLHPENETRLLSIPVNDTREQTRAVFRALALGGGEPPDLTAWHALQSWLTVAEHRVVIPFAERLAENIAPVAVRLRRDVGLLLTLIKTVAVLHQASRGKDERGRIVAEIRDYATVRELVADLIAAGVDATVPATLRETVAAVRSIVAPLAGESLQDRVRAETNATASVTQIAKVMKLDKSSTSRRVRVAMDRGFLVNLEDKRGKPARYTLGEPLPDELEILPLPEVLMDEPAPGEPDDLDREPYETMVVYPPSQHRNTATPDSEDRCSVAGDNGGIGATINLKTGNGPGDTGPCGRGACSDSNGGCFNPGYCPFFRERRAA